MKIRSVQASSLKFDAWNHLDLAGVDGGPTSPCSCLWSASVRPNLAAATAAAAAAAWTWRRGGSRWVQLVMQAEARRDEADGDDFAREEGRNGSLQLEEGASTWEEKKEEGMCPSHAQLIGKPPSKSPIFKTLTPFLKKKKYY